MKLCDLDLRSHRLQDNHDRTFHSAAPLIDVLPQLHAYLMDPSGHYLELISRAFF